MKVGQELQAGRFRILALLGEGAMGRVYHARDSQLQRDVALKTFRRPAPDDLYALKHEFRALAGFSHPNFVRMYELFSDAQYSFFTMEMIDGNPLLDYVRDGAPPGAALSGASLSRLRHTFRELTSGLHSLHEAGQIHRDVKPSNILVNTEGRAILVDFGLATLGRQALESQDGNFRGTLAYASPEQVWGEPASHAADWYALGVTLFETLTGRLPFQGVRALRAAEKIDAPRPSAFASGVPAHLDALVHGLLARDPGRRPGHAEILDALTATAPAKAAPIAAPDSAVIPFVGRDEPLARLAAAAERSRSRPGVIFLRGTSGIGKSELMVRFAESQRGRGALVLSGRCRHQESVAYRALDPLIDDLSRLLVQLPDAEIASLVPRFADALVRLFPVLARVRRLGDAPATGPASDEELLRRGFEALRELLARIGDQRTLILWIDDCQWGDRGSIALLRSLLRPPDAPRLLLVLSYRVEDEQAGVLLSALRSEGFGPDVDEETLSLEPLSEGECQQLVEQLAAAKLPLSGQQRQTIVDESAGSPFFLLELFRHALRGGGVETGHPIERVLDERLRPLSREARAVLDLVAVAGRPVQAPFILDVAGLGASGRPLVLDLCAQSLLRTSGREDAGEIETYHDRIRELVLGSLAEADLRLRHRQIADGLRAQKDPDPRALVEHYLGAAENELAAEYADQAARDAADQLAFDRAADLYALTIRLRGRPDGAHELEMLRAEALHNAGRMAEAGDAYIAAAEALARTSRDPDRRARLICMAAARYLYAGRWWAGLERAREVVNHYGVRLPETSQEAMRRANWLRLRFLLAQPHRRFRARSVPPSTHDRLDVLYGLAGGMGLVLARHADFLGMLCLREALAVGDSELAASLLAKEASIECALRGPRWRRRAVRLIEASRRIAGDAVPPLLDGKILICEAAVHFCSAEWERAISVSERALHLFRHECVGAIQGESVTLNFLIPALAQRGDLDRMRRLIPEFLEVARRRGDLTAQRVLLAGDAAALVALARDDPKGVLDDAQRLNELIGGEPGVANPFHGYVATWRAEIYAGQVDRALRRTVDAWNLLSQLGYTILEGYTVQVRSARAATALACAARGGMSGISIRQLEKIAKRDTRWLERSKLANAAPLAASLRASFAALRGDELAQRAELERARRDFERADMPLHANACVLHLAELGAADGGPALEWMEAREIVDPRAMARAIVPGVWS